jgi:hypothetical protein
VITVYTAMIGDTDTLRAPTVYDPAVRYVCFTDRARVPDPYVRVDVRVAPGADPRLLARRIKILGDPALGAPAITLWHDAAYRLRSIPSEILEREFSDELDLVALRHPDRTQIEDEAREIARLGLMPADVLAGQVATYRAAGFTQTAITSTGFCVRRQTPRVHAFNQVWWAEVERWGWRDQMSVDFAIWRAGIRVGYLFGHYRHNPYADWVFYHPRKVPA